MLLEQKRTALPFEAHVKMNTCITIPSNADWSIDMDCNTVFTVDDTAEVTMGTAAVGVDTKDVKRTSYGTVEL